jgi:hypothetical protein
MPGHLCVYGHGPGRIPEGYEDKTHNAAGQPVIFKTANGLKIVFNFC